MRKKIKIIGLNLKTTTMNIPVTFLYFYMYKYTYIFEKIVKSLGCVWLFQTPLSVVCQAPLSIGILQARILEWVAMSSSRASSHPGVKPWSPILRQILYHLSHQGSPSGVSIMWIFVGLMLSQMSIMLSLFFFILFSIFCFLYAEILCSIDFHHSLLQVNYLFFCLSYSAIDSFWSIIHLC